MKVAHALCFWCGKKFKYLQITKPKRYCSGGCEYRRGRYLQNERRRVARLNAAH
jgi:hypothetical protein